MRTRVYVDGFNLYYQLRKTQTKWLNPVKLAHLVLPKPHKVEKLRYFTARVSGVLDPRSPARQQVYLNALGTLPEVEIHFGSFLSKTIWRPVINLPVAHEQIKVNVSKTVMLPRGNHFVVGLNETLPVSSYPNRYGSFPVTKKRKFNKPHSDSIKVEVHTLEEKGSDVSLACHLLNDAWKELFDVAAVISNDTDLVTPIDIVTREIKKPVILICPKQKNAAKPLEAVASHVRHTHPAMLKKAQFPEKIPGTTIVKPAEW